MKYASANHIALHSIHRQENVMAGVNWFQEGQEITTPVTTNNQHVKTQHTQVHGGSCHYHPCSPMQPNGPDSTPCSSSNPTIGHEASSFHQIHTTTVSPKEFMTKTDWVAAIEKELEWHIKLPVTSPTISLVFVNDPTTNGEFQWPAGDQLLQPNTGLCSLGTTCHINRPFITTENRLCELAIFLTLSKSWRVHQLFRSISQMSLVNYSIKKSSTGPSSEPILLQKKLLSIPVRVFVICIYPYQIYPNIQKCISISVGHAILPQRQPH